MKLVEKCHELKVEFLCGTEVESFSETENEIEIKINENLILKSEKVIFCTNTFSSKFLEYE